MADMSTIYKDTSSPVYSMSSSSQPSGNNIASADHLKPRDRPTISVTTTTAADFRAPSDFKSTDLRGSACRNSSGVGESPGFNFTPATSATVSESPPQSASTVSSYNSGLSPMNLNSANTVSTATPSFLSPSLSLNMSFPFMKSPVNKSPMLKSPVVKTPTTQRFDASSLPVKKVAAHELESFVQERKPLIIDTRCYNQFLAFKLKESVNVCIPSTLLKRSSYKLSNILASFNIDDSIKQVLLNSNEEGERCPSLLFVDSNSTDMLNYPLYQTILKFFNSNSKFDIWYLKDGIDGLDKKCSLVEFESPISSPKSAASSISDKDSNTDGSSKQNYTTDPPTVLSGFQLPSSTPANQKFISSLKKNVPKLDLKSIHDNEDVKNYDYSFKFPETNKSLQELPQWLKTILVKGNTEQTHPNDQIIKHLNIKFNKIEKIEQIRLGLAVTDSHMEDHHSAFCSPSTPCPKCDDITYKIPKGIEYGFKNRYNNIWPYEHSRVKLIQSPCICNNNSTDSAFDSAFDDKLNYNSEEYQNFDDYFNGNYINYPKISNLQYIATQNPLPSTYKDFWKLIWNNNIKLIVCLNSQNSLQLNYFDTQKLGKFEVVELSVENRKHFNLRTIKLMKNGQESIIYHLEFMIWPDFGVPDIQALIDFIEFKNDLVKQKDLGNQTVVHCSAGCGRTGCYIAIDSVIDLLKSKSHSAGDNTDEQFNPFGDVDLIYKSIQFQRTQRISMCQNFDQYIVCYETILRYLFDYVLQ